MTAPVITATLGGFSVVVPAQTDLDWLGIIIKVGATGFDPEATGTVVYDGQSLTPKITGLADATTYYVRIAAYDTFGKTGLNWAAEQSVTTVATVTNVTLQTASSGQRIVINAAGNNQAEFYGDQGDDSVVNLCQIGINSHSGTYSVIRVGRDNSGNSRIALYAQAYAANAIEARTRSTHHAVMGLALGSGNGAYGESDTGAGVLGISNSGPGGLFQGNSTRGSISLTPRAEPTGASGDLYVNSTGNKLKFHNGTAWAFVGTYEEGEVTTGLVLTGTTTNPSAITYGVRSMKWQRIGAVVHFSLHFQATPTGGTGNIRLAGLPYAASIPSGTASLLGNIPCLMDPDQSTLSPSYGGYVTSMRLVDAQTYMEFVGNENSRQTLDFISGLYGSFEVHCTGHYFV